jgi:hypothetical protein
MRHEPAFPQAVPFDQDGSTDYYPGMTLRDYFAGQVVSVYLNKHPADRMTPENCAAAAYRVADAMLEAREKHEGKL